MKCKVNGGHRYGVGSHHTSSGVHASEAEKWSKIVFTSRLTTTD
jgi:hypothetical protein